MQGRHRFPRMNPHCLTLVRLWNLSLLTDYWARERQDGTAPDSGEREFAFDSVHSGCRLAHRRVQPEPSSKSSIVSSSEDDRLFLESGCYHCQINGAKDCKLYIGREEEQGRREIGAQRPVSGVPGSRIASQTSGSRRKKSQIPLHNWSSNHGE